MGCCGRNKKKVKSRSDLTNNSKKKKIDTEKKVISTDENQLSSAVTENLVSQVQYQAESPVIASPDNDTDDFIAELSSTDNIAPVKTSNDLQNFVQKHEKPVSMVLFYGRYCPYSKRTMPDLRQWARANKDRIFLYEVDVEQASDLAENYHIRSIPTIMAFEGKDLLIPIWQRSANNTLPSSSNDQSEPMEADSHNLYVILDPSFSKIDRLTPLNETKEEDLIVPDQMPSNFIVNLLDEEDQSTIVPCLFFFFDKTYRLPFFPCLADSKSIVSSAQSSYIWNQSTQSLELTNEQSSRQSISEYNGRMISQSTIATTDSLKKEQTWNDYLVEHSKVIEYPQHIHLPNCNEIFYEKQFDNSENWNEISPSDRLSTLTYQQVQDRNNSLEEICVLYLGPHRNRGFEDNLSKVIPRSSKDSLLTLQSN